MELISTILQSAAGFENETRVHAPTYIAERLEEWEKHETDTFKFNLSKYVEEQDREALEKMKKGLEEARNENGGNLGDVDWSKFRGK